jgi:NDP-sugar pyrophosphorylase family protein
VAILAGGLGTRLGARCLDRPKALVEIASVPFIHHQLRLLRRKGVTRVVILIGRHGEMIRESVGDGAAFDLKISYSSDHPRLLGTGGALAKALEVLPERFLVLYGDSWLDTDYQAVWRAFLDSGRPALMTVWRNEDLLETSNVLFEDGEIKLYDKKAKDPSMRHVDYGLSGLSAGALAGRPEVFDLAEVFTALSGQGLLAGYEVEERFYEIGSPKGLLELDALARAWSP